MMKNYYLKIKNRFSIIAKLTIVAVLTVAMQLSPLPAQAASLTQMSDVMTREKASTASDHEIKFVTPSGVASGGIITLTFSSGFTGIGSLVGADFDFAEGSSGTCSSATFTEKSVVTSSPSTSQFSIAGSGQVVTITSGGASATITAGRCARLRIGLIAVDTTGSGPGTHQITNGAIGSNDTIAFAGSFGDTGTIAVEILANDQITVQATVDPTITFTLIDSSSSDNTIGFGSLTTGAARYATATGTYSTGGSASDTSAVTMTIATNASSGYVLTYLGDTLKSGSDSIAVATFTGDADGTPGSGQFATSYTTSGTSTVATAYANASNNWSYVANTTTTIVSRTTPTNTETIGGHYLANIAGNTPAGAYSTAITYVATGTF